MKRSLVVLIVVVFLLVATPLALGQTGGQAKTKATIEAVNLSDDITPPQLTEVASPEYSPEAKKKKIEGTVTIAIVIDKKGDVVEAKVVKGLGYGLDENAVAAVKEYKYKPAEKGGEPIAVRTQVTVDFYLRG